MYYCTLIGPGDTPWLKKPFWHSPSCGCTDAKRNPSQTLTGAQCVEDSQGQVPSYQGEEEKGKEEEGQKGQT
ncbi:hypothetical protein ACRRTK_020984 [Alexandromys fortis]